MPVEVDVVTIERRVFRAEDVRVVVAPGQDGDLGVLARHTPLITALRPGQLEVHHADGQLDVLAVGGGFMEVRPFNPATETTTVLVLADSAERDVEIDIERAEAARRRAEELIKEGPAVADLATVQAAIHRAEVRLRVARRRRRVRPGMADQPVAEE
jgi:F-type H+-transporting ATPase subunit epsilon